MANLINLLTLSRILLAPIIFLNLVFDNYLLCLIFFSIAGLTDYFDGYLARKYNSESQLGEILDPIADKILVIFIFIGLSVTLDSYLIGIMSSFIISREIGIAALRDYSARNSLSDKTKVTFLAKVKTSAQLFTIGLYLLALALDFNLLIVISDIMLIISTLITLYTGYEYIIKVLRS